MLAELEPDVEALLVNRMNGERAYYRTPIDECFKLVGLIRAHWRGLVRRHTKSGMKSLGSSPACKSVRARDEERRVLDLNFTVESAEPEPHAAAPLLIFKLRIAEAAAANEPTTIPAIALRCQIRIEPTRRRYAADEQERLLDLFGERERWGQTLRSTLWTHASVVVPPFTGRHDRRPPGPLFVRLQCGRDQVFPRTRRWRGPALPAVQRHDLLHGPMKAISRSARSPGKKRPTFRLPVSVWKDMMELYYPKCAWLCLGRDAFDRLYRFKSSQRNPDLGAGDRDARSIPALEEVES